MIIKIIMIRIQNNNGNDDNNNNNVLSVSLNI